MNYDSRSDTLSHIGKVHINIDTIRENLRNRAIRHDLSKLDTPEKEVFDTVTPKLRGLTYGSAEYKNCLVEMGVALEHHYKVNSHHPEHYGYAECNICFSRYPRDYDNRCGCGNAQFTLRPDINKMSLLDIVEMLADWKAATERHADGNLMESLKINKERFEISEQLYGILENTARELGWV